MPRYPPSPSQARAINVEKDRITGTPQAKTVRGIRLGYQLSLQCVAFGSIFQATAMNRKGK